MPDGLRSGTKLLARTMTGVVVYRGVGLGRNVQQLPNLERFCSKVSSAIRGAGVESRFLSKWGLADLDELGGLLRNNVQGGYESYVRSILATPATSTVLSVGPGMGLAELLLAEIHPAVFVAEPDADNCELIRQVSGHYVTERGAHSGDILTLLHAGLAITEGAIRHWNEKRDALRRRGARGSILNFSVDTTRELRDALSQAVDRVYLHKVLSSLSVATTFQKSLGEIASFLSRGGVATWAEPEYIFREIGPAGERERAPRGRCRITR